jgi:hypothetical protein
MSTNSLQDKYEKIGNPMGDDADTLSSTPIGSVAASANELLDYYPIGGGQPPVPPPVAVTGAWSPADVVMSANTFTFASANSIVSNPLATVGRGTVRNTTSKTSGKKYIEFKIVNYGNSAGLGLSVGFSATGAAYTAGWNVNTNDNFTWTPDGVRNSHGQTNTDPAFSGAGLAWPGVNGDTLRMGIDIGVGVTFVCINSGTPRVSTCPFTAAAVKAFACLGDGNFGAAGDSFQVQVLTNAATQGFAPFADHTPWDD